ncbi:MBL fold metallo-hydrolase [Pedobacter panaciterrae]|uniref:MBL fold metallo-hydrolase n=1 Tax=Pedobacter panaciterrae TaxID=363849 RepID=A0ABU8NHJ5_9SPHI
MKIKKVFKRLLVITLISIACLGLAGFIFFQHPSFGSLPAGARLNKMIKSPNYKNGEFVNFSPTPIETGEKSKFKGLWDFLFENRKDAKPLANIPNIKVDLRRLPAAEDVVIWLGHSSIYMQIDGKKILIDPVLVSASPVSFINKPFAGSAVYAPEDMPDIDYLITTHDHWDHLDYNTIMSLRKKVSTYISPLGVGAHLEYWGVDKGKIQELDWYGDFQDNPEVKITAVPARHFSGRGLSQNKTLWAGYIIHSRYGNFYISGDTGYDTHFSEIKKRYGPIALAIVENGQYNADWKYIHMLPGDLVKATLDLSPGRLLTVHNSKYVLASHSWKEPLVKISEASEKNAINLITPKIGERVYLDQPGQKFEKWWKEMD